MDTNLSKPFDVKPWWTESSIKMVQAVLKPSWRVYEFGSGGSTVWLAQKVNRVRSIEDNHHWLVKVKEEIAARNICNVDVVYRDITMGDYMHDILSFPDESFNLIIVDNNFRRVEAFEKAVARVKRGGFILLDDSQNLSWRGCFFVAGMEEAQTSTPEAGKQATLFRRT